MEALLGRTVGVGHNGFAVDVFHIGHFAIEVDDVFKSGLRTVLHVGGHPVVDVIHCLVILSEVGVGLGTAEQGFVAGEHGVDGVYITCLCQLVGEFKLLQHLGEDYAGV